MAMEFFYPESQFGGFTQIDGTVAFYARVNALVNASTAVLDFGCGRGAYEEDPIAFRRDLRVMKGKARCVIGLDVNPAAASNPWIDQFHLLKGTGWPVEDEQIDLVICDNVLEHLPEPDAFFREARRVLKPGGCVCIRTPNRWNYIALFSRLIPNRQHARVLSAVKPSLKEEDVFPTLYRCNSLPALRRALAAHGFRHAVFGYEAEPSYLSFSKFAYGLGVLHQKLAPGFMRPSLFAFGQKKETG
jgi:SAM-dependent methyltransferase